MWLSLRASFLGEAIQFTSLAEALRPPSVVLIPVPLHARQETKTVPLSVLSAQEPEERGASFVES